MVFGRVIGLNGGNYKILTDDYQEIICKARGKLRHVKVDKNSSFNVNKNILSKKMDTKTIKLSPKVGDIVSCEIKDGINYIIDVQPRKNELIRPDISNVDQILLIFAAKKPDFSYLLLDLFLVNLEYQHIQPLIIITKIDLLSEIERIELEKGMQYYRQIGYDVILVNSKTKENIEAIIPFLKDKVSVLSGQTGAGKSTLINALIPGFNLQTQEISMALGRGKHTTRETTLYQYFGGLLGDTPGFSKLDLNSINLEEISKYFIEFQKYPCRFRGCNHQISSRDCGVRKAVEENNILESRLKSFIKIYDDVKGMRNK